MPDDERKDTFTYILKYGKVFDIIKAINETAVPTYDDANNLCQEKGGYLAAPESPEKVLAIKEAIEAHIKKFNFQSPVYLIGNVLKLSSPFAISWI